MEGFPEANVSPEDGDCGVSEMQFPPVGKCCNTRIGTIGTSLDDGTDISFNGTFDGGNNVVSGLHTNDGTKNYQGLFGDMKNSTVKNVGVVNGSVKGSLDVGSVAGNSYSGTVINCYNTGAVSGARGGSNVGGVVGEVYGNHELLQHRRSQRPKRFCRRRFGLFRLAQWSHHKLP